MNIVASGGNVWFDRSMPTPPGKRIWVTNGKDEIWMLIGDGKPFPDRASACKMWTIAILPAMPDGSEPARIEE